MSRFAAVVAVALVCGGAASAGGPPSVLAVEWHARGSTSLLWVNPLSLRPVPGGRLVTGEAAWPAARSPGGRFLLTTSATSTTTMFRVVDLAKKHASPILRVAGATGAHAAWARPNSVVALTFANGKAVEVLALTPNPLRVVRRTPLSGTVVSARPAGGRLVVLLAPRDGMGALRLAVADADAAVRTIELEGMAGGWESRRDGDDYVFRQAAPALVVDRSGRRAAVVGLVRYADVDLTTMTATTRAFAERRLQKRAEGWSRAGVWLSGDRVAIAGFDYGEVSPSPTGLRLVDLSDGTVRALDATSSQITLFGQTLVGWGRAVSVYALDGTLRYRLEKETAEVMAGPTFLYLNDSRDRTGFRVVDPADGRVLRRAETAKPLWVVHGL